MSNQDPRIDAYIAKSAEFARPILERLRGAVHRACPEVEETLKWGMPSFLYGGRILCGMAAFKQHCTFGFWDGAVVVDTPAAEKAMGQFGRITSLKELPKNAVLVGYIKKAVALRDAGVKPKRKPKPKKPELAVPPDLQKALRGDKQARATFENFSPSHRREYIEWITEAKREETRARRIAQTIEWLAAGKSRNWKYENC